MTRPASDGSSSRAAESGSREPSTEHPLLPAVWRRGWHRWSTRRSKEPASRWLEKRRIGRDAHIVRRGIVFGALGAAATSLLDIALAPSTGSEGGGVDLLILSVAPGGVAGILAEVSRWDSEEANLRRWQEVSPDEDPDAAR